MFAKAIQTVKLIANIGKTEMIDNLLSSLSDVVGCEVNEDF